MDKQLRTFIDEKLEPNSDRREVDAGTLQSIISFVDLSQLRQAILGKWTHGQPYYALFEKIIKRAKTAVAQWDGQIQFVYLPSSHRVFGAPAEAMNELARIRARVLRIVGDLNLLSLIFRTIYRTIQTLRRCSLFGAPTTTMSKGTGSL